MMQMNDIRQCDHYVMRNLDGSFLEQPERSESFRNVSLQSLPDRN